MNGDNGSISFLGALFITFIALKLTGAIDWSWLWVAAPFWGDAVRDYILEKRNDIKKRRR